MHFGIDGIIKDLMCITCENIMLQDDRSSANTIMNGFEFLCR